ncbi:hypothetical protein JCM8097_006405 [Rhodosporidiobolus ruineniae]
MLQRSFRTLSRKLTARTMSTAPTKTVNLEVTSDTVCPFCYVGYNRLNQAIRELKAEGVDADFKLKFAPFQLDPTLPLSPGENKRERYQRRFGGEEKVRLMEQAMLQRGRECDPPIEFSYGGNVSNTKDSHRVLEKAYAVGGEEVQRKVAEKLFTLYFEKEGDIGSHAALAQAAAESGVFPSTAEAEAFLASDELKKEVEQGFVKAQMRGISGVPFTIINGQFGLSGAQETQTFKEVLRKIVEGKLEVEED